MVHNPNYNVSWKRRDGHYTDDTIVMENTEILSSPPKSASDVGSPNICVAEDTHVPNHVYSIATPPQQSDETYSRLQWGTASIQRHPPPPPLSSQNERIPMRRMGSTTPSVASGQLGIGEYPISLNPSTISALSSVPSMSPDLIPPSNLYKSATLPTAMPPAPFSPNRTNATMAISLESVPENPSVPTYATPVPRAIGAPLNATPTPYLTPSMHSLLGAHDQVTVTPNAALVQYEELPPTAGLHFKPWYAEDHDPSATISSPSLLPASSSLSPHSSRPPREIQPYATIHNSAIPLSRPSRDRSHSNHLPHPPPALPVDSLDTSFSSAVELV